MPFHDTYTGVDMHTLLAFTFANSGARGSATNPNTGLAYTSADIGKLAVQSDTGAYYILTATTPTWVQMATGSGSGTVTSVALTVPSELSVSGTPITTSGTLAVTWASESAGTVLRRASGAGSGTPSFGALIAGDIPSLPASQITTGQLALARGGTNTDLSATGGTSKVLMQESSGSTITVRQITAKDVPARVGSTTSSATPTINTDNVDIYELTAQAANITSFTTNLSGTPVDGQMLLIQITGTAARTITWGSSFEASTVALPTTTVTTNRLDVLFIWNTVASKWRCLAAV